MNAAKAGSASAETTAPSLGKVTVNATATLTGSLPDKSSASLMFTRSLLTPAARARSVAKASASSELPSKTSADVQPRREIEPSTTVSSEMWVFKMSTSVDSLNFEKSESSRPARLEAPASTALPSATATAKATSNTCEFSSGTIVALVMVNWLSLTPAATARSAIKEARSAALRLNLSIEETP